MTDREIEKLEDKANETLRYRSALENSLLFAQKVRENFPLERAQNCELFSPPPMGYWEKDGVFGAGRDGEDYSIFRGIFDGKNWNEVDFDALFESGISHISLNDDGMRYYLPGFLIYYYDLKRFESMYFSNYFPNMSDFADGYIGSRYRVKSDGTSYLVLSDHSCFKYFSINQSKLIASFLVHVSTLSPSEHDAKEAQRALKNYWGKFLLL